MTLPSRFALALTLVLGLAGGAADAQQRIVLVGSVQWTSGNRLQMITDSGVAVNVDASRLDQSSYTGLRAGDRVRVTGSVTPDRRVLADTLEPDVWTFPQTG